MVAQYLDTLKAIGETDRANTVPAAFARRRQRYRRQILESTVAAKNIAQP